MRFPLERVGYLGHSSPVSLKALRRRVSSWIQRPIGQLAGVLLLVAMISAGMPTGKIHTHADGGLGHDHFAQLADGPSEQDEQLASADPAGDNVLHVHDVGTTVSALPMLPVAMLGATVPLTPGVRLTASPPPSSARIPPHRPPIA